MKFQTWLLFFVTDAALSATPRRSVVCVIAGDQPGHITVGMGKPRQLVAVGAAGTELGPKPEAGTAPFEVVVIDSVQKPSEN